MTGFLDRMASRATGAEKAVRLRRPGRFEPAEATARPGERSTTPDAWATAEASATTAPPTGPRRQPGSGRVEVPPDPGPRTGPPAAPGEPGRPGVPDPVGTTGGPTVAGAGHDGRRPRLDPARPAPWSAYAHAPVGGRTDPLAPDLGPAGSSELRGRGGATTGVPAATDPPTVLMGREATRARGGQASPPARPPSSPSSSPGVPSAGSSHAGTSRDGGTPPYGPRRSAPPGGGPGRPVDEGLVGEASVPDDPLGEGGPATTTVDVDVDAIVRDEVTAALAAHGLLPPEVRDVERVPPGTPRDPGRTRLTTTAPQVRPDGATVQVHIDRVEVLPAAPPPSPPAGPALPPVDHAAYLARRGGGR